MKRSEKGFTLIEILAAITILGILSTVAIISVNKIIQQGKNKHYTTAEENLKLAGQSYVQENRSALPKVIGQKTKIYLSTLESSNYINEILDYSDNKCDSTKSYVQVYKYSQNDYSYVAYLECPSYKTVIEEVTSTPTITITMNGEKKNASAKIQISDSVKLMSYSYIVYKDNKEILNSGSVSIANYAKSVEKEVSLSEYTPGQIKIVVTATNIYGSSVTKTASHNFEDISPPTCIISDEDKNPKTWTSTETRTITVGCDDGEGSGCTRTSYTKTFKDSAMTDYITISDESGNTAKCEVTVYIDKEKPSITVKSYARTSSGSKTGSTTGTAKVSNSSQTATLDLSKSSTTKWLNGTDYANGVYFEVTYSDDVALASYTVKENPSGLTTSTTSAATTVIQNKTTTKKSLTDSYTTTVDGYRTYVITATDIAGNSISIGVIAPLDRQAPTIPTVNMYKWKDNSTKPTTSSGLVTYTNNTWTNLSVYTTATGSTDTLSGFKEYRVTTSGATSTVTNAVQSYRSVEKEGTSYVQYKACDVAGNCSALSSAKTIKIDKTVPTCTSSGGSTSWVTNDITIKGTCSDGTNASGCAGNVTKVYTTTTNLSQTNQSPGTVYDNAGNSTVCPANQTIKIDKVAPTAPTSGAIGQVSGSSTTGSIKTAASGSTDTGGSGVKEYRYYVTNTSTKPTDKTKFTTSKNFTRSCGTSYYAWVYAVDNVGHTSSIVSLGSTADGKNEYVNYGSCSKACDGGTKTSANSCALITKTDTISCNTRACCTSSTITYKDGSSCTAKCGGGTYNRLAYSTYDSSVRCSSYDKTSGGSSCNTQGCCSKVTYQNGSTCSKKCGGGTYNRVAYSYYDGTRCPSSDTTSGGSSCNTQDCCSKVTYQNGSTCSASCGYGTYNRLAYSDYDGTRCSAYDKTSGGSSCYLKACEDTINGTRYNGCDSYYITTCTETTCKYTSKNGASSSGTVTRSTLTMSRTGSCDKTYCSAYISSRSGTTVTFTVSPSSDQCKITSYSAGSCSKSGSGNHYVKVGYSSISDGSYCGIRLNFSGIAYIYGGVEYKYISWNTYRCSSTKFCTQSCSSSACVS